MVKVNIAEKLEEAKKKINSIESDVRKRINSIEYDVHWYRRVFHTFGASFILYYMLPDVSWINLIKFWVPLVILIFIFVLEYLRIKGKVDSNHFFGLRMYEKKRVSSYLYFGIAIFVLLLFFPQQIAIPCILCASIVDPVIGEVRHRYGGANVYIIGFLLSFLFFIVTWYKADLGVALLVSTVGAIGAVVGETKKFKWLDDDFMIQMVPAILILIIWFSAGYLGLTLPGPVIYPGVMPW
jgi:dolichol kinase